jgi:hypothetical protein
MFIVRERKKRIDFRLCGRRYLLSWLLYISLSDADVLFQFLSSFFLACLYRQFKINMPSLERLNVLKNLVEQYVKATIDHIEQKLIIFNKRV